MCDRDYFELNALFDLSQWRIDVRVVRSMGVSVSESILNLLETFYLGDRMCVIMRFFSNCDYDENEQRRRPWWKQW